MVTEQQWRFLIDNIRHADNREITAESLEDLEGVYYRLYLSTKNKKFMEISKNNNHNTNETLTVGGQQIKKHLPISWKSKKSYVAKI